MNDKPHDHDEIDETNAGMQDTAMVIEKWRYQNIADASQNARKIYFLYIAIVFYCVLTVIGTTDRQIILNDQVRLPIVDLEVPLNGFFITAPLLTLFVYIYFQLYLQRIKGLKDDLCKKCSKIEKRRLYPWIVNIADDPEEGIIGTLQQLVVKVSLWWLLPVVLMVFSLWIVKAHNLTLSTILSVLPLVAVALVIFFSLRYKPLKKSEMIFMMGFVLVFEIIVTVIAFRFANGVSWENYADDPKKLSWNWIIREISTVDLSYQTLVQKPEIDDPDLYWLRLENRNLAGANLSSTILKKAYLKGANLRNAYMKRSNLQEADLREADLSHANLESSNLKNTKMYKANCQRAKLNLAKLQNSYLAHANFYSAELEDADFSDAQLMWADLRMAKLDDANFQGAYLAGANFKNAYLIGAKFNGANLTRVNFAGANLRKADFSGAITTGTIFTNAIMDGTLSEALSVSE